jgi:bisphosphoglycerate-dependent phosphoglycerate mutase
MALTAKERDINVYLAASEEAMLALYKNLKNVDETSIKDLTLAKNILWGIREMQAVLQRAE